MGSSVSPCSRVRQALLKLAPLRSTTETLYQQLASLETTVKYNTRGKKRENWPQNTKTTGKTENRPTKHKTTGRSEKSGGWSGLAHLNMYSMYLVSMKGSLMDTTFTIGFFKDARSTSRPMRPKPLMPTVTGPTDWSVLIVPVETVTPSTRITKQEGWKVLILI